MLYLRHQLIIFIVSQIVLSKFNTVFLIDAINGISTLSRPMSMGKLISVLRVTKKRRWDSKYLTNIIIERLCAPLGFILVN